MNNLVYFLEDIDGDLCSVTYYPSKKKHNQIRRVANRLEEIIPVIFAHLDDEYETADCKVGQKVICITDKLSSIEKREVAVVVERESANNMIKVKLKTGNIIRCSFKNFKVKNDKSSSKQ